MDNRIQVFDFNERAVRCILKNSEPWWVAKDVCDVLGLGNPTEALRPLDEDEKSTLRISEGDGGHGGPERNIISESGLYTLILRSNKPEARAFRRWVTHEVLPTLRRTGVYGVDEDLLRLVELARGHVGRKVMSRLVLKAAGLDRATWVQMEQMEQDIKKTRHLHRQRAEAEREALVRRFIEEECRLEPEAKVSRQGFYEAFLRWCQEERIDPVPPRALFTRTINAASLFPVSSSHGVRFWVGVHVEHA